MFAHGLSMHQRRSNYALTNLLFGFYRSMWIIDLLVTRPSPHPSTPFYPCSVASQGMCPNSLSFHCFHLGFTIESIKELGSVSSLVTIWIPYCVNTCWLCFFSIALGLKGHIHVPLNQLMVCLVNNWTKVLSTHPAPVILSISLNILLGMVAFHSF